MSYKRATVSEQGLNRKARTGDGWLAHPRRTNQSTDSNQTIAAAAIAGGLYSRSGTNTNRTDTTDTAANILAMFPEMDIGDTFVLVVSNPTAGTLTIQGGSGVTASGNLTIAATSRGFLVFEKTSATTMTAYGV